MKRVIATIAVAAAAVLGTACDSEESVTPEILTEALVDQGVPEEVAECISTGLWLELDEDQFREAAFAQSDSDMSPPVLDAVYSTTESCIEGYLGE